MQWYWEVMQRTIGPMAKLNPIQRFEAIQRGPSSSVSSSTLWIFVVLGIVIVAGIVVIGSIRYIQRRRKKQQQAFNMRAMQLGLSDTQRDICIKLSWQAKVNPPVKILTSRQAFNQASTQTPNRTLLSRILPEHVSNVCTTCPCLPDLERKLHQQDSPNRPDQSQSISGDLSAPAVDNSSPLVTSQEDADTSPAVIKVNPVEIWQGDSLLMRYPQGQAMWQFNANITQTKSGQVVIKPLDAVRWGDRRRTRRSLVDIPAQVAAFPFDKPSSQDTEPQFVQGKLIEMGAQDLRLRASIAVEVNQRVLVILTPTPRQHIESMGVVRRIWNRQGQDNEFAVELLGLTPSELSVLDKATQTAAISTGQTARDPDEQPTADQQP